MTTLHKQDKRSDLLSSEIKQTAAWRWGNHVIIALETTRSIANKNPEVKGLIHHEGSQGF